MPQRNYDIAELRSQDVAHHLPPQSDYGLQQASGGSRIIVRAHGSTIHDGDGNSFLDAMAGLWCVHVGYGRERLARAAHDQLMELSYYSGFFRTTTPPTVQLATRLSEKLGGKLSHLFFNNSGSEAIDTIIRLVRYYFELKGQSNRQIFIGRYNGYHGTTVAGVSLGGMAHMKSQGGTPLPGFEHVPQPYLFGEGFGEDPRAFGLRIADALEARILELGPENVAAFIGEPVQGAGGVVIPPASYWPRVAEICRKYGILLVSDEVICGFGRLGRWFGFEHFGFEPDLVAMAKGLSSGYIPISAVGVSSEIVETLRSGGDFAHGYTYSGHPAAAAVALANLDIIEEEQLVERAGGELGAAFAAMLQRASAHRLVGEARSLGLLGALELVAEPGTNKRFPGPKPIAGPVVRDRCLANGLVIRALKDTIALCPPLVITLAEIERIGEILLASLDEAAQILAGQR
jgi:putrescine---pyruvate transaminase